MKKKVAGLLVAILVLALGSVASATHYDAGFQVSSSPITAYDNSTGNYGSSGNLLTPYLSIAVHYHDWPQNADPNNPMFPYGSWIRIVEDPCLSLPNGTRCAFRVEDTGLGPSSEGEPDDAFWFDVFFGNNTSGAVNFGTKYRNKNGPWKCETCSTTCNGRSPDHWCVW